MSVREQKQRERLLLMTEYERRHWEAGETFVAGLDEAGRGPLAGPVVAACVIMPHDDLVLGINDSKQIAEKRREELYALIVEKAVEWNVGVVDEKEIDRINILNAAHKAFLGALAGMKTRPHHVYTDAMALEPEIPHTPVIKGDQKLYTIAAASIVAKVTRDAIMREYDKVYPEYGFAQHKGYGTRQHYEAIHKFGVLDIHRKTFLKKILDG